MEVAPDQQVTEAAAGVAVRHHVEAEAIAVVVEADSDKKEYSQQILHLTVLQLVFA